jgi:hypothetical protein
MTSKPFALAMVLSVLFACGGKTVRDDPRPLQAGTPPEPPQPPQLQAPVAEPAPQPLAPEPVADSQTLAVDIGIYVDSSVLVSVTVRDPATGEPITDAVVTGGPIGRSVAMQLQDGPYMSVPNYSASFIGYEREWEFSIVRGSDYLKGVKLVGPSSSVVKVTCVADEAVVAWSPANEAGVSSGVCAWGTPSRSDLELESSCAESEGRQDEGSATVTLPAQPHVWVTLDRTVDLPVGAKGGRATFALHVLSACDST